MSQEREFIENLLYQRLNAFLLVFTVIVAGATQANKPVYLKGMLLTGSTVCALVAATLCRSQQKLDIIIGMLTKDPSHPIAAVDKVARRAFGARRISGLVLPMFCMLVLMAATFAAFQGWLPLNR